MSTGTRSSTPATALTAHGAAPSSIGAAANIGTFSSSLTHNDQDREDLLELCELAGVAMSRELLNTIHSLLSSPLNVSPTALFHVLKEATTLDSGAATDRSGDVVVYSGGGGAIPSSMVEVNGSLSKRKIPHQLPQTPR